ncbi:MAG: 5'-nucleotidase C-terminal domain-containing protein [Bacteroidota bacterium]
MKSEPDYMIGRTLHMKLGFLLVAVAAIGCSKLTLQTSDSDLLQIAPTNTSTLSVEHIISPYRDSVSKEMDQIIGYSLKSMERGKPESTLGNFVSDVCMERINDTLTALGLPILDLFVFNSGGLRGVIPQGAIKRGEVFQVMPFDNELVWTEVTYDSLLSLFNYIGAKGGVPVSGISLSISNQRCSDIRLLNGRTLETGQTYRIGTNDFLANGGDGMTMLSSGNGAKSIGVKVRDAIIEHITDLNASNTSIDTKLDGRIHEK